MIIETIWKQLSGTAPDDDRVKRINATAKAIGMDDDIGLRLLTVMEYYRAIYAGAPARITKAVTDSVTEAKGLAKAGIEQEIAGMLPSVTEGLSKAVGQAVLLRRVSINGTVALLAVLAVIGGGILAWKTAYEAGAQWQHGLDMGKVGVLARYEEKANSTERYAAALVAANQDNHVIQQMAECSGKDMEKYESQGKSACAYKASAYGWYLPEIRGVPTHK